MSTARYSVRRLGWYQPPHGDPYTRRVPTAVPVASFDSFDNADVYRQEREAAARDSENPFRFGGASIFFQSSLDGPRLHDWLMDAGIEPPASELRHSDWRVWWDAFAHTWNHDQLAHAWDAFDKVRFFEVTEELPGEPLHLIQEVRFVDRDSWFPLDTFGGAFDIDPLYHGTPVGEADPEGGVPLRVYRTSRRATAMCEQFNRDPHRRPEYLAQFGWLQTISRRQNSGRATVFEVAEITGEIPSHAGVAYLVQRRVFDGSGHVCHDRHGRDTGSRLPVRLFAERTEANAHRDELAAMAVRVMNPFQVYTPRMSGLNQEEYIAGVAKLAAPLPWPTGFELAQWREWWDLCQGEATDEQRTAAWALFADHPLFEVLRVEVSDE